MPQNTLRAVLLVSAVAMLAACASAPTPEQEPAGVEDRKPTPAGADTQPVTKPGIAGVDLTGGKPAGMSILTDPKSILSKRSVFYDLDKYDVRDEYKSLVEAHAKFLRDNPKMKMLIQGNTDERGSREYNLALGQKRSDGLRRMLQLLGVKEDQLESVSLGEEKPRAPGSGEEAWSQNRRSDMLYSGEF